MNDTKRIYTLDLATMRENRGWFMGLGIALIFLGILAIALPFATAFAVEILIGWLFAIGGVILGIHAFRSRRWGRFFFEFLTGLLYLGFGFLLLTYPMTGVMTLTMLLAVFFMVEGVFKAIQALRMRPAQSWGWAFFSGLVSLFLGFLILSGLPLTAFWAIGVVVGVDLIFSGLSLVMISSAIRGALREGRTYCIGNMCFNQ